MFYTKLQLLYSFRCPAQHCVILYFSLLKTMLLKHNSIHQRIQTLGEGGINLYQILNFLNKFLFEFTQQNLLFTNIFPLQNPFTKTLFHPILFAITFFYSYLLLYNNFFSTQGGQTLLPKRMGSHGRISSPGTATGSIVSFRKAKECGRNSRLSLQLYVCIVLYSSICMAPLNSHRQTEALVVRLAPRKETSFKK